jgi:hypothetical protein
MTDEEVIKFYEELKAHYGETLVNFEHYPRQFSTQVRLYKYFKSREEKTEDSPSTIDFTDSHE